MWWLMNFYRPKRGENDIQITCDSAIIILTSMISSLSSWERISPLYVLQSFFHVLLLLFSPSISFSCGYPSHGPSPSLSEVNALAALLPPFLPPPRGSHPCL